MKYLSKILITAVAAVGLTACYDDAGGIMPQELSKVGDVPVNISFSMTDKAATTRSIVGGEETPVSVMQLICFDANGKYLGIRNADVTSQGAATNPPMYDHGIVKGAVPEGTSRIHFIANRSLTLPLSFSVGTDEETVMKGVELTSYYKDNKKVSYWGYHKAESAAAMKSWLNPAVAETSKVYMIRDRAKVILEYDPADAPFEVTSIKWLIHNGHSRGYLAPKKGEWESYYGNSTIEGHTNDLISKATMNEFTAVVPGEQSRYTLWTSDTENEDTTFDQNVAWNGTSNTLTPQFLFDDDNSAQQGTYPKIILKVTYDVTKEGETPTSKTVYHVLKLKDNNDSQYDIVRNNTYYIKCKLLSPDVAYYETLKEAINGEAFMDGELEIDRTIAEVNNDDYTLQIKLPTETTSIVLNSVGVHNDLFFVFRDAKNINNDGSTDPTDFNVYWENSDKRTTPEQQAAFFCTDPIVTFNDQHQFVISTQVKEGKLTDKLQDEWIVVEHKTTHLKRYIHVFVIDQFRYKIYPTLTKVGNDYKLSFQLPPMEHTKFLEDGITPDPTELVYPQELYPIDVKFTTNTLNAYGIESGKTNYGLFGSSIESTKGLTDASNFEADGEHVYNDPVSSTNYNNDRTHWYFQQADNYWDFWYTYSLKTYPTGDPDVSTDDGIVNIYFKDVRDHIKYANVQDVGLFLYVEYFGKNYSVPGPNN